MNHPGIKGYPPLTETAHMTGRIAIVLLIEDLQVEPWQRNLLPDIRVKVNSQEWTIFQKSDHISWVRQVVSRRSKTRFTPIEHFLFPKDTPIASDRKFEAQGFTKRSRKKTGDFFFPLQGARVLSFTLPLGTEDLPHLLVRLEVEAELHRGAHSNLRAAKAVSWTPGNGRKIIYDTLEILDGYSLHITVCFSHRTRWSI